MSGDIANLLNETDALELGKLVRQGEVKPIELVEETIARIEALNPKLNAVCTKTYDLAREMAEDPNLPDGPFKGVPFGMKDLAILWQGVKTTNGCTYFKDFVSPVDMELTRRIKAAGFVLVGRTNAPEYGWCLATEPALHGRTNNPWNETVTPGGSSGGSSAALASGMVPFADGSDGGGSIRVPASHTGLVGLKPSRGRVTLAPLFADFWYGGAVFLCLSRTVRETAAYLDAVGGRVAGDPYYTEMPSSSYLGEAGKQPGKLRIAVTTDAPDGGPVHDEVKQAVRNAAKLCEELGHTVEEKPLTYDLERFLNLFVRVCSVQTAMGFEASAPLVGHEVGPDDVCPVIWGLLERGRAVSGVTHSADIETFRMMGREVVADMGDYDVRLMPVMRAPARPHGYYDMTSTDLDKYHEKLGPDVAFTAPFNMSGQPAISLPLHWTRDGLPVGVQFVGRECDEATLLRLAAQIEEAKPWKDKRAPIHA